jgi:quercetin dioxygenase-like cupin family protein
MEYKMKRIICVLFLTLFLSNHALAKDVNITAVQVEELAKAGISWDGSRLPAYPKERPEITILRIKIPPGSTLHVHEHPVINAGVLLSGELTVITEDNKKLHLKAGEAIIEVVNTWHYGKNEGSKTAELIVFYAGIPNKPITVKKEYSQNLCKE